MQRPAAAAKVKAKAKSPPQAQSSHHHNHHDHDHDSPSSSRQSESESESESPHELNSASASASASTCNSAWDPSPAGASLCVAYFLWATLGLTGAHHAYLGRDKHAILWLCSFGGFGVGWFRDLFRLPAYVALANREWTTLELLRASERVHVRPPWSVLHRVGQMMFAWWFGTVLSGCCDTWASVAGWHVEPIQPVPNLTWQSIITAFAHLFSASVLASASPASLYVLMRLLKLVARTFGMVSAVWLVGGVNGTERCRSIRLLVLAAVLGQAWTLYSWQNRDLNAPKGPDDIPDDQVTLQTIDTSWYAILATCATYHTTREWIHITHNHNHNIPKTINTPTPTPTLPSRRPSGSRFRVKRGCGRVVVLIFVWSLLVFSLGTYTLTCVEFETSSGDSVTILDAIRNFVHSPAYRDMMAAFGVLYNEWRTHGTHHMFQSFKQQFDIDGTAHALQVLELPPEADYKAIRSAYRRLILKWHPDKQPPGMSAQDRDIAAHKFQLIQQAYETLQKHHQTHQHQHKHQHQQAAKGTASASGSGPTAAPASSKSPTGATSTQRNKQHRRL